MTQTKNKQMEGKNCFSCCCQPCWFFPLLPAVSEVLSGWLMENLTTAPSHGISDSFGDAGFTQLCSPECNYTPAIFHAE